jgi:hypothetical protein
MNRLLLSVCLVGAASTGGHTLLHINQHLPTSVQTAEPQLALAVADTAHLNDTPVHAGPQMFASAEERQWVLPKIGDQSPVPSSSEGANEEPVLVVVTLGTMLHASPNVSAAIIRFYPVGTKLHVISHEQDWFQLRDPATAQTGWIYKLYLDLADGRERVAVQDSAPAPMVRVQEHKVSVPPTRAKRRITRVQPRSRRITRYRHYAYYGGGYGYRRYGWYSHGWYGRRYGWYGHRHRRASG